jgi:tRNA-dihydrouridine synthase B
MQIGNLKLSGKVLAAPLAGVSAPPFRALAVEFGAALVYTEMISSEGVIRCQKKTLDMVKFSEAERPIGVQIFGANPESMNQAAAIICSDFVPDLIDINFGCPVRKVVGKNGGAAVLKDMGLAREIMQAVVEGAGSTPVTIKIRTGWDDQSPVYIEAGRAAEEASVAAVTLHARSRAGAFSGRADWHAIADLKKAVNIPVIGNGDIFSGEDAARMIEMTDCDAVMVGRASMSNPAIFHEINHFLQTGRPPEPLKADQQLAMARRHAELMTAEYGPRRGAIKMRKFLTWYVRGLRGATALRRELVHVESLEDIDRIFKAYLTEMSEDAA